MHNRPTLDILKPAPMAILFSITILAFCALLWASFAVARHLRHAAPPQERRQAERDRAGRHASQILRDSRS